ncbi:hypothetical protein PTKIN_Ptkin12aG0050100 [Pterospermum kingtungense]
MGVSYATTILPSDPRPGAYRGSVIVPIYETAARNRQVNPSTMINALMGGFELEWVADSDQCRRCKDSGGFCGYNHTNSFICFYNDQPRETTCFLPTQGKNKNGLSLPIGLGIGGAATAGMLLGMGILFFRRKTRDLPTPPSWKGPPIATASVEAFIVNFGSLAPKRYSYRDIKKMTHKFKHKLGQGGYGSVYKGELADGRLVAVKFLSESKGHGEDFMIEVASIGRTSHVNIVTLLGFCYDRSKRALVYEFMALGSLDKFIYKQGSQDQSRQLEWKTLYDIALGIARGLEYLHQGCSTRILHFDIKPHNILLDENFCPKISDFGLSKLCERKESIIYMTGARGTVGYIAPEVFCRNFGGVSHKSDVYSYGMMVLEMVGGRKNINVEVSQSSEIYFPS